MEIIFVVILVLLLFISILNLGLLFRIYNDSVSTKHTVSQLHAGMVASISKLGALETMNIKLGSSFNEFINMTGDMVDKIDDMMRFPSGMHQMFRTMDGKFSARTIDELIEKIKKANKESDYLSDDELKKLKDLFDNSNDEDDDDPEEDK